VNGQAKAPANVVEQRRRGKRRVVGAERVDNRHHRVVELVGSARTTLARDQAGQPVRLERRLRVIEGRPRTPESLGGLRHRVAVDLDPPHHLVFHLDQVPRIEELVRSEQGVAHVLGVQMESPMRAQGRGLCIPSCGAWRHCNLNYASYPPPLSSGQHEFASQAS
jgi:hypothetical protein